MLLFPLLFLPAYVHTHSPCMTEKEKSTLVSEDQGLVQGHKVNSKDVTYQAE